MPNSNSIVGVYERYTDAQRVRHEMIVSGYSSHEVEVASPEELKSEYGMDCDLPDRSFVLLLRSL